MLLFEWLGPFIEAAGYIFVLVTFLLGYLSYAALVLFISFAIGFGLLVSVTSLLLEELSFHTYPKVRHILILCVAVLAENLGYRQINAYWRIKGLVKWVMGTRIEWGEMKRVATWQAETGSESESAR